MCYLVEERSVVMTKMHPPKTGLEVRFEDEMASAPHWQRWDGGRAKNRTHKPHARKESPRDRIVEETMILGR